MLDTLAWMHCIDQGTKAGMYENSVWMYEQCCKDTCVYSAFKSFSTPGIAWMSPHNIFLAISLKVVCHFYLPRVEKDCYRWLLIWYVNCYTKLACIHACLHTHNRGCITKRQRNNNSDFINWNFQSIVSCFG